MGRPRLNDGLNDFKDYMIHNALKKTNTVKNYMWYVRKILAVVAMEKVNCDNSSIERIINTHISSSQHHVARSAWNAYAKYMNQSPTAQYPLVDTKKKEVKLMKSSQQEPTEIKDLPEDVRSALLKLSKFIPIEVLCRLTWENVDLTKLIRNELGELCCVASTKQYSYYMPSDYIKLFLAYSNPGTNKLLPVIPQSSGSSLMCTVEFMKQQLAISPVSLMDIFEQTEIAHQEKQLKGENKLDLIKTLDQAVPKLTQIAEEIEVDKEERLLQELKHMEEMKEMLEIE